MTRSLTLPAFTTAHSHAFQRALRGKTQRPSPAAQDDFWTWREAMYDLVDGLTPERVEAIAQSKEILAPSLDVAPLGALRGIHRLEELHERAVDRLLGVFRKPLWTCHSPPHRTADARVPG